MKKITLLLSLASLATMLMSAQQPRFEVADVHVSPTLQRMAGGYVDHPIVDATGLEDHVREKPIE